MDTGDEKCVHFNYKYIATTACLRYIIHNIYAENELKIKLEHHTSLITKL